MLEYERRRKQVETCLDETMMEQVLNADATDLGAIDLRYVLSTWKRCKNQTCGAE